jgi:hypothetical protein
MDDAVEPPGHGEAAGRDSSGHRSRWPVVAAAPKGLYRRPTSRWSVAVSHRVAARWSRPASASGPGSVAATPLSPDVREGTPGLLASLAPGGVALLTVGGAGVPVLVGAALAALVLLRGRCRRRRGGDVATPPDTDLVPPDPSA